MRPQAIIPDCRHSPSLCLVNTLAISSRSLDSETAEDDENSLSPSAPLKSENLSYQWCGQQSPPIISVSRRMCREWTVYHVYICEHRLNIVMCIGRQM